MKIKLAWLMAIALLALATISCNKDTSATSSTNQTGSWFYGTTDE